MFTTGDPSGKIAYLIHFSDIYNKENLTMKTYKTILTTLSVFAFLSIVYASNASAHCDTLDGPVVAMSRIALDKGDVTPSAGG